jgi:hypothetical protein
MTHHRAYRRGLLAVTLLCALTAALVVARIFAPPPENDFDSAVEAPAPSDIAWSPLPDGEPDTSYVLYDAPRAVKPALGDAHLAALAAWKKAAPPRGAGRQDDGSALCFGLAWIMQARVAAFEATGDIEQLDAAREDIEYVLGVRDDKRGLVDEVRGRVMKSWSTAIDTGGMATRNVGKRHTLVLYAGNILQPVVRWAYVVNRDPHLRQRYGEDAGRYLAAAMETVADFDAEWRTGVPDGESVRALRHGFSVSPGGGYYYCPVFDDPTSYNRQNAMGRALVALYLATGRDEYRLKATALARQFKGAMREMADGGYAWFGGWWTTGTARYEDTGHAATSVQFVVDMHKAHLGFSGQDVRRLALTFERFVRRKDGAVTGWWWRIDGTDDSVDAARADGGAALWAYLGLLQPSVTLTLMDRPQTLAWPHPAAWALLSTVERPLDEPLADRRE